MAIEYRSLFEEAERVAKGKSKGVSVFSDILAKYQLNDEAGKFTKFMSDYFVARGCNVKINPVN